MKNKAIILILITFFYFNQTNAQINPLDVVDKVVGTIFPTVVNGIKNIKDARRRFKDDKADELKADIEEKKEKVIRDAKKQVLNQLKSDINYIKSINLIQQEVQRMNSDVGKLSIYQDPSFIQKLKTQEAVTVKNEIVRKFQNALEIILDNKDELESLRKEINKISLKLKATHLE